MPVTAVFWASRGCGGAAGLWAIGLGVQCRAAEALVETRAGDRRGLRLCIGVRKVALEHVTVTCLKFLTTTK